MRLARKAVVKRIKTPKKSKMKPFEPLSREVNGEIQRIAEIQVGELPSKSRLEFLKIALTYMFLINAGPAVALISVDRYFYVQSIYLFGVGAAQTAGLALCFCFTDVLIEKKKTWKVISKLLMIYLPLVWFMAGLITGVSKSASY